VIRDTGNLIPQMVMIAFGIGQRHRKRPLGLVFGVSCSRQELFVESPNSELKVCVDLIVCPKKWRAAILAKGSEAAWGRVVFGICGS